MKVSKIVLLLCLLFLLCLIIIILLANSKEGFENDNSPKIEIIISRYNENLEWLKKEPFKKYKTTIYNKGNNDDYLINTNTFTKSIKTENIGRCDHTYLYHIIKNYENLADINIFLPGSVNMENKIKKSEKLMEEIEKNQKAVFLYDEKYNDLKTELYDFKLDNWIASNKDNQSKNPESVLEKSQIRPFGKWFESNFGKIKIEYLSIQGIFSVAKEDIIQHPKIYYENLIRQLSNSSNPEAGHYFERAWEAVFYPMSKTIKIQQ